MPMITNLKDLPKTGSLMALDHGKKNWGIAVSDPERRIASPITVIKRTKFLPNVNQLFELYHQRNCTALIVGLPLNLDGSFGSSAQSAQTLVLNLLKLENIPILLFDERLTTKIAENALLHADLSRKQRAKSIDKIAAALILKTVLERLEN